MTARIYIAALALLGAFAAGESLKGHSMPTEAAHPKLPLDTMPFEFGPWTGEDLPLPPDVAQAIGAEMVVNRAYRNKAEFVELHCDVFTDSFMQYGVRVVHSPELCSPISGFVVEDGEMVQIASPGKPSQPARLLTLSREGNPMYCLYWYQVGDTTFWNSDDQRRVVHSFRGRATWPPMIKVMLQTSAGSLAEAEQRLTSLAVLVYPWVTAYR
jgi:EpsI family protein